MTSLILTVAVILVSILILPILVPLSVLIILLRLKFKSKRDSKNYTVGFFHPYCTAGGGGERVLWCAVKSIQEQYPELKCYVYTGDSKPDQDIFNMIKTTFNIDLNRENCKFLRLKKRNWVEASKWPRFTLIGQSLGSMLLGWEALNLLNPDLFIDTMGYAFTFPIFKLIAGSVVACYVHYPTISTDMLSKVKSNSHSYNNDEKISNSKLLTNSKLIYYKVFSFIYWFVGKFSDIVMVNGKWTGGHIQEIWKRDDVKVVYPPVDVESRKKLPLDWMKRENIILSIAQFRPEKDHSLQLESLAYLLNKYPIHRKELNTKLILVGSCRDKEDQDRVSALRKLAEDLQISNHVEFKISVPIQELNQLLSRASVGIHTMWCEHFGIGVVELAAAGVIPVAHNSGGPKKDIVQPDVSGFLARTKEEYAEYIHELLTFREKYKDMQVKARESVDRFSQEGFETAFIQNLSPILNKVNKKSN